MIATYKKQTDFLNRLKGKCFTMCYGTVLILINDIRPFVKNGVVDAHLDAEVLTLINKGFVYDKKLKSKYSKYFPHGVRDKYVKNFDQTLFKKLIVLNR